MSRTRSMIGLTVESPDGTRWMVADEHPEADELTLTNGDDRTGITRMDIATGGWRVVNPEAEDG